MTHIRTSVGRVRVGCISFCKLRGLIVATTTSHAHVILAVVCGLPFRVDPVPPYLSSSLPSCIAPNSKRGAPEGVSSTVLVALVYKRYI